MKLFSLQMPPAEFDHVEKGDALHGSSLIHSRALWFLGNDFSLTNLLRVRLVSAMELALSLEKLTNEKLLKLHSVLLYLETSFATQFVR